MTVAVSAQNTKSPYIVFFVNVLLWGVDRRNQEVTASSPPLLEVFWGTISNPIYRKNLGDDYFIFAHHIIFWLFFLNVGGAKFLNYATVPSNIKKAETPATFRPKFQRILAGESNKILAFIIYLGIRFFSCMKLFSLIMIISSNKNAKIKLLSYLIGTLILVFNLNFFFFYFLSEAPKNQRLFWSENKSTKFE